jgi:Ca2+-binding RTX toxin-like protein
MLGGGSGNDHLFGGKGDDVLLGGSGNDYLIGDQGPEALHRGFGHHHTKASGDQGDDILYGGSGNDYLIGGRGDDVMAGGSGHDKFVFQGGGGHDVVLDFEEGQDIINIAKNINGLHIKNAGDVAKYAEQVGDDTVVNFGHGDTLTLVGVSAEDVKDDPGHFFHIG